MKLLKPKSLSDDLDEEMRAFDTEAGKRKRKEIIRRMDTVTLFWGTVKLLGVILLIGLLVFAGRRLKDHAAEAVAQGAPGTFDIVTAELLSIRDPELACYVRGQKKFLSGSYGDAREAFASLGDYRNSREMLRRASYHQGSELLQQGSYEEAAELLRAAEGYEDADSLALECAFRICQQQMKKSWDGKRHDTELYKRLKALAEQGHKESIALLEAYRETIYQQFLENSESYSFYDEEYFAVLEGYKDADVLIRLTRLAHEIEMKEALFDSSAETDVKDTQQDRDACYLEEYRDIIKQLRGMPGNKGAEALLHHDSYIEAACRAWEKEAEEKVELKGSITHRIK